MFSQSSEAVVPEGHDAYITLIPSGPIGSKVCSLTRVVTQMCVCAYMLTQLHKCTHTYSQGGGLCLVRVYRCLCVNIDLGMYVCVCSYVTPYNHIVQYVWGVGRGVYSVSPFFLAVCSNGRGRCE